MSAPKCLAVMYHYVRDREIGCERQIKGLSVEAFERQMDAMCETMTPIDWSTLVAWRMGRAALPDYSFVVTFDDGLSDHAEVVAPLLEARGVRGVFFVPTSVLVEGRMSAAHQIHLLLCHMDAGGLCEEVHEWLDRQRLRYLVDGMTGTLETLRAYSYETPERAEVKHLLTHTLPLDVRDRLVDELFARHVGDQQEIARRWYLNWDDVKQLERRGHTIGGHGHGHTPYRRLTASEQARDMNCCASILKEVLGEKARPFSYPYGDMDADVARRCAFAGFVNGFTTRQGWIGALDDAHGLSRVDTIHVDAFLERKSKCLLH